MEATSALFVGFLFVTGIQFLLFGMWFDQAQNEKLAPDYAVWRELMTPAARRGSSSE